MRTLPSLSRNPLRALAAFCFILGCQALVLRHLGCKPALDFAQLLVVVRVREVLVAVEGDVGHRDGREEEARDAELGVCVSAGERQVSQDAITRRRVSNTYERCGSTRPCSQRSGVSRACGENNCEFGLSQPHCARCRVCKEDAHLPCRR